MFILYAKTFKLKSFTMIAIVKFVLYTLLTLIQVFI